jgi:hypothetical protein
MPVMRYFLVTETRTIKVSAPDAVNAARIAQSGFDDAYVPEDVQGSIRRGPVTTGLNVEEER